MEMTRHHITKESQLYEVLPMCEGHEMNLLSSRQIQEVPKRVCVKSIDKKSTDLQCTTKPEVHKRWQSPICIFKDLFRRIMSQKKSDQSLLISSTSIGHFL